MEELWSYLAKNPVLVIVLLAVIALVFSKIFSRSSKVTREEDLVPHYKRFERREVEYGDRRKARMKAKAKAEEEQRQAARRKKD